jgi:hypothetical protein
VSGHFEGTNIQFTIYLPPADQWEGRFFQWTYPIAFTPEQDTSRATDRAIGFALASGGYAVQAGNAGVSLGYRHTAAAAKFARTIAAAYYGTDEHIYGYLYGGSGGSYQTIGAAENSTGVWDGYVPYIIGTPMSSPYTGLIRAFARLLLADKAEQIKDAVSPGGSGDPYADLDAGEAAMLRELISFGVPLAAWQNPSYVLMQDPTWFADGGLGFGATIRSADPGYVHDFWNTPGYLGTEDSPLGDAVRAALAEAGDTVDNRWDIAVRAYYRHQLPPATAGYVGFDQFRAADGTPLYPQRSPVWGPLLTSAVSGGTPHDGEFEGKMIVVDNLVDSDALPHHADWYADRVEASLGTAAYRDSFRLYFNDNADHQEAPVSGNRATYLVTFWGMVEQAHRDLSAWVEDGVRPPDSTRYDVVDAQVVVPDNASARRGVQPTVDLTVRGSDSVTIAAGQTVGFHATARVPARAGEVVATAWDFEGDGTYVEHGVARPGRTLTVKETHRFDQPGVYYVALRVTAQRDGVDTPYAKVQNLDRVRVVVHPADH